jgi:hypothetical protein
VHLSRIAEEIVIWSSEEVSFIRLDDRYSTGSSMMPQKKNPDIAELTRAKAARLIGHLTGVLAMLKGLPLAYNRDLQEDKEPLFDAIDQMKLALSAMSGLIGTLRFDRKRMEAAADSPYLAATDLAEWLVGRGTPFRDAHALVGSLVRDSLERNVSLPELVAAHPSLGEEAAGLCAPGQAVLRRSSPGAGGPEQVAKQLAKFQKQLDTTLTRLQDSRPCRRACPGASSTGRRSRSPRSSSAWRSVREILRRASSRSRPTSPTTRPATASSAPGPGPGPCSGRPDISTCIAPTASIGAPTSCVAPRVSVPPCCSGRANRCAVSTA